jgi:regulator of protease activity HflC (stomatin/prohibitin superfamily)
MQAENKIKQAEAEAKIKRAQAEGNAESLKIQADAEAYANLKRQQTLTPLLIQQQFLEKWNGQLPQYGVVPQIFKDISK